MNGPAPQPAIRAGSFVIEVVGPDAAGREGLVVEEEDRHRVLSAPPVIPEKQDHPIPVMTAVWDFEPCELGALIRVAPRRWLAVVHDLEAEPSLDEEAASKTLRRVLDEAETAGFEQVSLTLWGVRHGPWSLDRSLELFLSVLLERWRVRPRVLEIRVPWGQVESVRAALLDATSVSRHRP